MKEVTIDCTNLLSPAQLHRAFAQALSFPAWYGCNGNALHDCLTAIRQDTTLILRNFDPGMTSFLRVLEDSQKENKHLTILFK